MFITKIDIGDTMDYLIQFIILSVPIFVLLGYGFYLTFKFSNKKGER